MHRNKITAPILLLSLSILSCFPALTTAAPPAAPLDLHRRDLPIPPAPADPPKPATGDGIGPYNSQSAGWRDYLAKAKFFTIAATAGELGLTNAERGLRHYLGNSGSDLNVSPESMMSGLSGFRSAAQALAQNQAAAAYNAISVPSGEKAFSSAWQGYYATKDQSWDWFFAIGGFSYSVTGVVTKAAGGGGTLRYVVHIFDRYNWDAGKSVDIGPFHFEDRELGNLHLKGLAREYVVRGNGAVNNVNGFRPTTVIPPPSTGGRGGVERFRVNV